MAMLEPLFSGGRRLRAATLLLPLGLLLAGCAAPLPTVMPGKVVETLPPPADVPFGRGRIWQVDLPGQEPSYLFGTIHVTDTKVFTLPESAENAFAKAKIAAFETEILNDITEEEKKTYLQLPEDTRLYDVIGEETYRQMKALALFRFFTVEGLDRMQPWLVWNLIAGREIDADMYEEKDKPVLDDWLQLRAKEAGKEVVCLETSAEQLEVFAGIPMDDQVTMLRSAIDGYGATQFRVHRIQLYLDGDLAVTYALWQRFLDQMPADVAQRFHERLLDRRNRIMTERLMPVFARGSTFVAVGALHMSGENGLLRLLERRGYRITRLD